MSPPSHRLRQSRPTPPFSANEEKSRRSGADGGRGGDSGAVGGGASGLGGDAGSWKHWFALPYVDHPPLCTITHQPVTRHPTPYVILLYVGAKAWANLYEFQHHHDHHSSHHRHSSHHDEISHLHRRRLRRHYHHHRHHRTLGTSRSLRRTRSSPFISNRSGRTSSV